MSNTTGWLIFSLICGIASLILGLYLFFLVKKLDAGDEKAQEIACWIHGF